MKRAAGGWQVSGRLSQADSGYELAVPLRVTTAARQYLQTVVLADRPAGFLANVSERPVSLSVDPEFNLFRKLYPEEMPATVNNLRGSRSPLVIVADGVEALLDASRDLLRGLQWQEAPVMSEAAYLAQRPTGRDLIFLGWPRDRTLQADLPAGSSLSAQQFTLAGELYAQPDDVLFMVLDSRKERRVTAYFLAGSLAAARDTARRIPHYGRYSVLVFRAGRNLVKSTWEPVESPLKVTFSGE